MVKKLAALTLALAALAAAPTPASAVTRWHDGEDVTGTDGSIDCAWHGEQGDGSAQITCVEGEELRMYYRFAIPRGGRALRPLIDTSCPSAGLDAFRTRPRVGWVAIAFAGPLDCYVYEVGIGFRRR